MTLLTHNEKVGSCMNLVLAAHTPTGRELLDKAFKKKQKLYKTFPSRRKIEESNPPAVCRAVQNTGLKNSNPVSNNRKRISAGQKRNSPDSTSDEESEDDQFEEEEEDASDEETDGRKQKRESPLPASTFPFRKDTFFAYDAKETCPLNRTDEAIEFVCRMFCLHGFSHLLEEKELDECQVELLMIESWRILHPLFGKEDRDIFPSQETIDLLGDESVSHFFSPLLEEESTFPSNLEMVCKARLRRIVQPRTVMEANDLEEADERLRLTMNNVPYQHSFPVPNCVTKHRRHKPKIKGSGCTGAVLSDMDTFVAYLEYLLVCHAWCHYGYKLSLEDQLDEVAIDFGSRMVVAYFDTIFYRGDGSADADTCKNHSQLHNLRQCKCWGDMMQCNAEIGERGLKTWAKFVSRTAKKHGIDDFTHQTSERVGENLLLSKVMDFIMADEDRRKAAESDEEEDQLFPNGDGHDNLSSLPKLRKLPHFVCSES